ncbi:MAG TPA: DUF1801 domain-containing protein [Anaerolineales bacterium]
MDDFEKLLVTNQPEAQALARDLRGLIHKLVPKAHEKIYRGWGVADYGYSGSGRGFMSIGPQKKYVNLYFMDGVELPDPGGLLEGAGKRLRHVKIHKPEDLKNRSLHALIREAAHRNKA